MKWVEERRGNVFELSSRVDCARFDITEGLLEGVYRVLVGSACPVSTSAAIQSPCGDEAKMEPTRFQSTDMSTRYLYREPRLNCVDFEPLLAEKQELLFV